MQIIRTLFLLLLFAATLGGFAVIRGTATTPSGDVWYVRAGYSTAKVRDIYYCPSGQLQCRKALIVSREQREITALWRKCVCCICSTLLKARNARAVGTA